MSSHGLSKYATQWIIFASVSIFLVIGVYFAPAPNMTFTLDDEDISHTFVKEPILNWGIIYMLFPLYTALTLYWLCRSSKNTIKIEIMLQFLYVLLLTILSAENLKSFTGQFRPDFLGRCDVLPCSYSEENGNLVIHMKDNGNIPTNAPTPAPTCNERLPRYIDGTCSGNEKEVLEGMRGLPSTETTLVGGLATITCLLFYALSKSNYLKITAITISNLVVIILTNLSIIEDYQHSFNQALIGTMLGSVEAFAVFFLMPTYQRMQRERRASYQLKNQVVIIFQLLILFQFL